MDKDFNPVKDAVDVICNELKNDEGYFMGWQANIAIQFQDKFREINPDYAKTSFEEINKISNEAARDFLNLLIHRR